MIDDRWAEIRAATEAALALPAAARAAFLTDACNGDLALRAEVDAQIEACECAAQAGGFLAEPAASFVAPLFATTQGADGESDAGRTDSTDDAPLRGALAGHYDLERELGRGGTATVHLARDVRHGRFVALKVLDPMMGASMSAERFLREIRVTAGLAHPHILPLHDSGTAAGLLYYVMPYIDGETLRDRLARDGPLSIDAASRLIREVASALAYAHRRGVVHRDIKPANILLEDGHAVVADFGIARAMHRAQESDDAVAPGAARRAARGATDTLTEAGTSPGTPAYMAPEQARGGSTVDHRADLYALGVVAYEALSGERPFRSGVAQALVAAHPDEVPVPLGSRRPDVPPALAAMVMRMLETDPAARPQSASEVVTALDAPRATLDAARRGRLRPVAHRTTPRALGAALALVLLLVIGAGLALRARAARRDARQAGVRDGVDAGPVGISAVAVLPFVNTDGRASDDYFSDGLTDELAHELARLPGLRLAGRTSSYAFKGKALPAQQIGAALGVGALVGGTVRRAGDRLRVTAQLVSTADGTVLWDSVYESRSSDVFAVQDELTRAIAAALAPALGGRGRTTSAPDTRGGTADQEAYDLYLKGRYYWIQRGAANLARSIGYFRQAIARDSMFARAYAGLAMAYSTLPDYVPDPGDSATALTVTSARRAVALDSTLADAQLALGIALDMQLRFRDALARYRAAVALDPSSVTGHHWLGMSLLNLGHTDEAIVELRHATELDPLAPTPASALSLALLYARRFPEAQTAARRALALDSTFVFAIWPLGLAQTFGGEAPAAARTFETGVRLHPGDSHMALGLLLAYAAAGRWGDAAGVRGELRRPGGDRSGWADAAVADLVFGNSDPLTRVLTTDVGLRRYIAAGAVLGCNPLLDPLWTDAHFRAAMRRLTVDPCARAGAWPFVAPARAAIDRADPRS